MELGPHGIRVNAISPGSVEGLRIDAVIARDAGARDLPETEVRDVCLRLIAVGEHTEGLSDWLNK